MKPQKDKVNTNQKYYPSPSGRGLSYILRLTVSVHGDVSTTQASCSAQHDTSDCSKGSDNSTTTAYAVTYGSHYGGAVETKFWLRGVALRNTVLIHGDVSTTQASCSAQHDTGDCSKGSDNSTTTAYAVTYGSHYGGAVAKGDWEGVPFGLLYQFMEILRLAPLAQNDKILSMT